MSVLVIPGFTPSFKVPMVAAINQFGAGRQSIAQIPLVCVCFGNKHSSGTATVNERYLVTTPEEADTLFGPRSELARMAHAALDVDGVTLYCVAVTEAAGTAAVLPIDIGGTWSTAGELGLQIGEEVLRVSVGASETPTTFGDTLEDAVNQAQSGRLACVAANTAGRVLLTIQNLGVRGNDHVAWLDTSKLPSGMTVAFDQNSDVVNTGGGPAVTATGTPTGTPTNGSSFDFRIEITTGGVLGTSQFRWSINGGSTWEASGVATAASVVLGTTGITANFAAGTYILNATYDWDSYVALGNGGRVFYGGTGSDDIQAALDASDAVQNDYIALAPNDATNVAKVETECNAKAAFSIGLLEQYVVCKHRGLTAAISLGQTTMNDQLGTCLWAQDYVEHPSRVSARVAALFSVTDGAQPNTNYDDVVVPGAAPHKRPADSPNITTQNSALNNSLTPLVTKDDKLVIARVICSRSLNGATPDYRTYDHGDVAVPIRVRKELVVLGAEMKAANPYAGPDVSEGMPPEGTFTPRLWGSAVTRELKQWEGPAFNWLEQVDDNPVVTEWDSAGKRVMSVAPTVAKTQNHQVGVIVRQKAA